MCYIYSDLDLQGQTNISPKQTDSISSRMKAKCLKKEDDLAVAEPARSSGAHSCSAGGVNDALTYKHERKETKHHPLSKH